MKNEHGLAESREGDEAPSLSAKKGIERNIPLRASSGSVLVLENVLRI